MYDWHYQEAKITIMKGGYMRNFVYIYITAHQIEWISKKVGNMVEGCRLVKGGNL